VKGLVPAQRCFEAEGEPGTAANARAIGTVSIAGLGTRPMSRIRAHRAGDGLGAAAELPAVRPVRDVAVGCAMPARAAE
jgi:hypothetical protein